MKPKFIFCLALILSAGWFGCLNALGEVSTNLEETWNPCGNLALSGHTLYGTTSGQPGGFRSYGTVYKIETSGKGFAILHRFTPLLYPNQTKSTTTNSDGAYPVAGLVLSGDTLYGTAPEGGRGYGTVFSMRTDGKHFTVLHDFQGADGFRPEAGLVLSEDTLYGTTKRGGHNEGVIFKIKTDGSGFAVLHTFAPVNGNHYTNSDGAYSQSELVVSGKTLYGTAWSGGAGGTGTIFKVNTDGTAFTTLHSFEAEHGLNSSGRISNHEGATPESGLVLSGDTLYGTASEGGTNGWGTIFKLNTTGTDFSLLHTFTAIGASFPQTTNSDGGHPGGLILSGDTLYGTTREGGGMDRGTVFRIKTDGTDFNPLPGLDNSGPFVSLMVSGGRLYGTTPFGGSGGGGTVFKIEGKGNGFAVLHSFTEKPLPGSLTD